MTQQFQTRADRISGTGRLRRAAAWLIGVGVASSPGWAATAPPGDEEPEPARPMLITESSGLVAGTTNFVAVSFDIDEGWHVYWPGQNDTGFATTIELTLPEGWEAGEPRWPAPHRYVSAGGILDHVYEDGEATILIPIVIPEDAEIGPARLSADLEWLVCREACIPGWKTVGIKTSVLGPMTRPRPSEHRSRFQAARARFPVELPLDPELRSRLPEPGVTIAWKNGVLVVSLDPGSLRAPAKKLAFYPDETGSSVASLLKSGASSAKPDGTPPSPLRLSPEDASKPLRGIIEVEFGTGTPSLLYRIETAVPDEQEHSTPSPE